MLERGATRRRAPHNAASYLIGRALRYGRRVLGWRHVKAFSDPRLGERGLVYSAAGFERAPPSRHRDPCRYALLENGRCYSDRAIRRRHGSHAAARAAGATIVRIPCRVAWEWRCPPHVRNRAAERPGQQGLAGMHDLAADSGKGPMTATDKKRGTAKP